MTPPPPHSTAALRDPNARPGDGSQVRYEEASGAPDLCPLGGTFQFDSGDPAVLVSTCWPRCCPWWSTCTAPRAIQAELASQLDELRRQARTHPSLAVRGPQGSMTATGQEQTSAQIDEPLRLQPLTLA